mmetsp:Transcript_18234/g.61498  ORF Transcript_18234/g.61498 Transcript_18234/m.61498 type:complete len:126 (-) Transcript_18234:37-414(-)
MERHLEVFLRVLEVCLKTLDKDWQTLIDNLEQWQDSRAAAYVLIKFVWHEHDEAEELESSAAHFSDTWQDAAKRGDFLAVFRASDAAERHKNAMEDWRPSATASVMRARNREGESYRRSILDRVR